VTQPFWEFANAASADLFQHTTSQLLALFRSQGRALPVAEELAQKVTGELTARVRKVLRRPGLGSSWISGVIQVGHLKLDLERHMLWRGDDEIHLSPKECDLLACHANPEYIVSEPWIGYRFSNPAGVARRLI
jgi:hypothetical protein